MKINYTLKPVAMEAIEKVKNLEKFSFIESTYWDLFQQGNRFYLGKWKFYPIRDANHVRKTAMDVVTMNRQSDAYIFIAEDGDENYIAYHKEDGKLHFINDHAGFDIDPPLIYDDLDELLEAFSYKSNSYAEHENKLEAITRILDQQDTLYYLYNRDIKDIAGTLSVEFFPAITFFFWTTEAGAKAYQTELWENFELRTMSVDTFYNEILEDFAEYGDVVGIDWENNGGEDFFAEALLEM